jgi:hypothetical protein
MMRLEISILRVCWIADMLVSFAERPGAPQADCLTYMVSKAAGKFAQVIGPREGVQMARIAR